jgi:hypothetical protein
LDGADHLSLIHWGLIWWRSRAAGGLIVTSHERRLLPLLTRRETSLRLLRLLCDRLETSAALPAGLLDDLFVQHRGNIRDVFRHLYDICAGWGGSKWDQQAPRSGRPYISGQLSASGVNRPWWARICPIGPIPPIRPIS